MSNTSLPTTTTLIPRSENQALGIGRFAIEFLGGSEGSGQGRPSQAVLDRTLQFFTDSVLCGLSALAMKTNAPCTLRAEALDYPRAGGAAPFGSTTPVAPEKAILANC